MKFIRTTGSSGEFLLQAIVTACVLYQAVDVSTPLWGKG